MPHPLQIFSQSDYLIQIVYINLHTDWQTGQIQISWLFRSHLICIYPVCKGRVYPGSAGQGLISYRNSVHSVRRETKMSKTSCPWSRNLTVYSVRHLKLNHVLTAFLSYRLNAIQMHKCKFLCPKCTFKGKLLIRKC